VLFSTNRGEVGGKLVHKTWSIYFYDLSLPLDSNPTRVVPAEKVVKLHKNTIGGVISYTSS